MTKSQHILPAASNLLGFSFFVLTSIKTLGVPGSTLVDEFVVGTILCLALSVIFSFSSIRTAGARSVRFEAFADYTFLLGVISIAVIALLLFFSFV